MLHAIAECHIQWLYLAANGCKTYLNLNQLVTHMFHGHQGTDASVHRRLRRHAALFTEHLIHLNTL
jgi:hypothetical protein